ncbi:MAG: putative metal-binding motif-containing protein [Patescibacteria group bacterium]
MKKSAVFALLFAFSNCGVSGTKRPTCEFDSQNCDCGEYADVYQLAPDVQTVSCGEGTHLENDECVPDPVEGLDQDGDGYLYPEDCDDKRVDVYPGAPELCDARDNDCDGEMDGEGVCSYECASDFTLDIDYGSETEVSISAEYTLDYGDSAVTSGCRSDAGDAYLSYVPIFVEAGEDFYKISFKLTFSVLYAMMLS